MGERRKARTGEPGRPRGGSLAWDVGPLLVLAGAGVALLQAPGRRKTAPPAPQARRSLKTILLRTRAEFVKDQVPMVAAGVSFYTLLALFPGIAAFVALYGLFADVSIAERHLRLLSFVLTPQMLKLIGDQMLRVATANKGGQSLTFAISVLISIWSANGAVRALMTGLTIAYDQQETRGLVRRTAISLAFTLGFLVFFAASIGLLAAGPAITAVAGRQAARLFGWISWPLLLAGLTVGLSLLYRFGPNHRPGRGRWITWGSLGVVVVWACVSALFSLYVDNFGTFDKTYGSLGAVIGFMMWMYLSALIVLAGAELNAEIARAA